MDRPYTNAILAVSLDGKITTAEGGPPRFATKTDKRHLMEQRARADAVLLGGASVRNENPRLVVGKRFEAERRRRGQVPQPLVAVVSASGDLGPDPRFLQTQGEVRLYTAARGRESRTGLPGLRVIRMPAGKDGELPLRRIVADLRHSGVGKLQCEGGGELIQRMLRLDLIDELSLTICPVVIGGRTTPSAAGGAGFGLAEIARFDLVSIRRTGDELYTVYRRKR